MFKLLVKLLAVLGLLRRLWPFLRDAYKYLRDWWRRRKQGFGKAMIRLFLNRKKRFGR